MKLFKLKNKNYEIVQSTLRKQNDNLPFYSKKIHKHKNLAHQFVSHKCFEYFYMIPL